MTDVGDRIGNVTRQRYEQFVTQAEELIAQIARSQFALGDTALEIEPMRQERGDQGGVADVVGQAERHLRLVADREPGRELGALVGLEEGVVAFAARRLLAVPDDARRADVNSSISLPGGGCGQRAAIEIALIYQDPPRLPMASRGWGRLTSCRSPSGGPVFVPGSGWPSQAGASGFGGTGRAGEALKRSSSRPASRSGRCAPDRSGCVSR